MKRFLNLAGLLFASLVALSAADAPASRPNIVFIFTDDQPQNAMSCMGNKPCNSSRSVAGHP